MLPRHIVPRALPIVRWGVLAAVVLGIIGGILGMHVLGGAQAAPMAPTAMSGVVSTTGSLVESTPVAGHTVAAHAVSPDSATAGPATPDRTGGPTVCGCAPSGCGASMAMHGTCVPVPGSAALTIPIPDVLGLASTDTPLTSASGPKSLDRVPDAPSLNQLSISRT
ncbi:hypothetical protein [Specibacter cremeus]|uniref:hypothetical protein n=1 Tax=Specibacter cremeus TaxID=1629051 RepID=UPI000F792EAD|nr:hypothetical protein [Specibacter cremeus]